MNPHRGIHGFDLTTGCDLFFPERVFALVGQLNARRADTTGEPVGIEVYPTRPMPWARVDARHLRDWQFRYSAPIRRIHVEFVCDEAELQYVLRHHRERSLTTRAVLRAMYRLLPDAASGQGVSLATTLGVAVNVHANVLVHWRQTGQLSALAKTLPDILAENNILGNYLYVNGPITYDPRTIALELVGTGGISGLLLALDHLIEHYPTQRIDPLVVLDDPHVRQTTRAIHIAGPNHAILKPGDSQVEPLLRKLARTDFAHRVRLAFDYSPMTLLGMPFQRRIRLFSDSITWIRQLHEAA